MTQPATAPTTADTALLSSQRAVPHVALANGFEFRYPDLEQALRAIYGRV